MEGPLRDQISGAVSRALEPLSDALAGWEGGSAAFGLIDNYSDIDLFFLVNDNASAEPRERPYGAVAKRIQANRAGRFRDLMGPASYERDGNDILSRGLYLDLPAWGYHVFEITSA